MTLTNSDRPSLPALLIAAISLFSTGSLSAGLIHSQTPRDGAHTIISDNAVANDFSLSATTTLGSFRIWVGTGGNSGLTLPAFSGTIGWAIYGNGAGAPGTLLASGQDSTVTLTPTGDINFFTRAFQLDGQFEGISFGSVANLSAGTYWFALHEGNWGSPSDGSSVSWMLSTVTFGSDNRIAFNPTAPVYGSTNSRDNAFELFSAEAVPEVPEPSSLLLLATGGLIGAVQRVRRQSRRA
jgi:hypothetical protein